MIDFLSFCQIEISCYFFPSKKLHISRGHFYGLGTPFFSTGLRVSFGRLSFDFFIWPAISDRLYPLPEILFVVEEEDEWLFPAHDFSVWWKRLFLTFKSCEHIKVAVFFYLPLPLIDAEFYKHLDWVKRAYV